MTRCHLTGINTAVQLTCKLTALFVLLLPPVRGPKSQSDVVWKVERSCRSESKPYPGRGNGKYRKQQGGKHFDASKCEGWEKEEEQGEALPRRRRRQLVPARPLSLPSRSFPPAISRPILQRLQRVRCALRALMMPISLSILLPSHFGRVIKIHRDMLVSYM